MSVKMTRGELEVGRISQLTTTSTSDDVGHSYGALPPTPPRFPSRGGGGGDRERRWEAIARATLEIAVPLVLAAAAIAWLQAIRETE